MKKAIDVLLSALFAVCIVLGIGLIVDGCTEGGIKGYFSQSEEVKTANEAVEAVVNPDMGSVSDVVNLYTTLHENAAIDSAFLSLKETTLIDVASVALKKLPTVTKKDIVELYKANRDIYDNLPKDSATTSAPKPTEKPISIELVKEGTTTVTEAPPTRVETEPAGSYKDTTINGKHALIKQ